MFYYFYLVLNNRQKQLTLTSDDDMTSIGANEYHITSIEGLNISETTRVYIYDDNDRRWSSLSKKGKKAIFFASMRMDLPSGNSTRELECGICMQEMTVSMPTIWHISNKKCGYLEKVCTKCVLEWIFHRRLPICPICKTEIEYKRTVLEQK